MQPRGKPLNGPRRAKRKVQCHYSSDELQEIPPPTSIITEQKVQSAMAKIKAMHTKRRKEAKSRGMALRQPKRYKKREGKESSKINDNSDNSYSWANIQEDSDIWRQIPGLSCSDHQLKLPRGYKRVRNRSLS